MKCITPLPTYTPPLTIYCLIHLISRLHHTPNHTLLLIITNHLAYTVHFDLRTHLIV